MIIDTFTKPPIEIENGLPPIRVFRLGSHAHPATTQEIEDAMKYIEQHGDLPKDWPVKFNKFKVNRNPLPGTWLIQLGSALRPATQADIDEIEQQIAKTAHEKELTIITHHNFHMTWVEQGKALISMEVRHKEN